VSKPRLIPKTKLTTTNLTRHYQLNSKQIHILKMTYKFRFITAPLLAQYKGWTNTRSSLRRLENLYVQGYLGKYLNKNELFQNKGTRYYLTPKALIYLRDNFRFNESILHAMYKNKSVGEAFIDHSIAIIRVYLSLRSSNPDVFKSFTANELGGYDFFPTPKPDLYLLRKKSSKAKTNEYLVYIFNDVQLFIIRKQFTKLLEHFDSGDWEAETGNPYPAILYILKDSSAEKRIRNYINTKLDWAGIDDLKVLTTNMKELLVII